MNGIYPPRLERRVAYSGQEAPPARARLSPIPKSRRAYLMFRHGKDTLFIAEHYHVRESTALRWISEERSRLRGLPNPYRDEEHSDGIS